MRQWGAILKIDRQMTIRQLFFLIIFLPTVTFGQTNNSINKAITDELNFNDTLKFVKASFYRVRSLDCFSYQIRDSIETPYIPDYNKMILLAGGNTILIAIKQDNDYSISQFEIEQYVTFEKPERISFSGTGYEQLLLKWSDANGVSHRDESGGNASYSEGFIIIDLEEHQMVANFTSNLYYSYWDPDTLKETCYRFIPTITTKEIIFTQADVCNNVRETFPVKFAKPIVVKYRMEKNALIKVK